VDDDNRALLEQLEPVLREWGDAQACAMLAILARNAVSIPDEELQAALRRALLVLAAGGDPYRELEREGPGVTSFAADIDSPEHRAQLYHALRSLRAQAEGLPRASYLLDALVEDVELAWRSLAVALLAEELGDDD